MFFVIDSFEKGPAINDVGNFFRIFDTGQKYFGPAQKLFRVTHFRRCEKLILYRQDQNILPLAQFYFGPNLYCY